MAGHEEGNIFEKGLVLLSRAIGSLYFGGVHTFVNSLFGVESGLNL